jgi:DNA-binding LacI/PurR family transcriptional regulator
LFENAATVREAMSPISYFSIRDVAAMAGVSVATVSRVTNGIQTVDPVLADRVRKAVKELNYTPDQQAKALVSGRSRTFGLLISELTNPFFPELIQSFETIAVANGYEILLGWMDNNKDGVKTYVRRVIQRKAEGVAVMTFGVEPPILRELIEREIPLVFIDAAPIRARTTVLEVDYYMGIHQAVQHLRLLGHSDIGFVSGPLDQSSAKLRLNAFFDSLKDVSLKPRRDWILQGDHTLEGGMAAIDKLISLRKQPTALMCSNDLTAIGALRMLARVGRRVPEDFSVIGYDDIHLAAFTAPPLTTVGMSRSQLARGAIDALLRQARHAKVNDLAGSSKIQTALVIRESTGPPLGRVGKN